MNVLPARAGELLRLKLAQAPDRALIRQLNEETAVHSLGDAHISLVAEEKEQTTDAVLRAAHLAHVLVCELTKFTLAEFVAEIHTRLDSLQQKLQQQQQQGQKTALPTVRPNDTEAMLEKTLNFPVAPEEAYKIWCAVFDARASFYATNVWTYIADWLYQNYEKEQMQNLVLAFDPAAAAATEPIAERLSGNLEKDQSKFVTLACHFASAYLACDAYSTRAVSAALLKVTGSRFSLRSVFSNWWNKEPLVSPKTESAAQFLHLSVFRYVENYRFVQASIEKQLAALGYVRPALISNLHVANAAFQNSIKEGRSDPSPPKGSFTAATATTARERAALLSLSRSVPDLDTLKSFVLLGTHGTKMQFEFLRSPDTQTLQNQPQWARARASLPAWDPKTNQHPTMSVLRFQMMVAALRHVQNEVIEMAQRYCKLQFLAVETQQHKAEVLVTQPKLQGNPVQTETMFAIKEPIDEMTHKLWNESGVFETLRQNLNGFDPEIAEQQAQILQDAVLAGFHPDARLSFQEFAELVLPAFDGDFESVKTERLRELTFRVLNFHRPLDVKQPQEQSVLSLPENQDAENPGYASTEETETFTHENEAIDIVELTVMFADQCAEALLKINERYSVETEFLIHIWTAAVFAFYAEMCGCHSGQHATFGVCSPIFEEEQEVLQDSPGWTVLWHLLLGAFFADTVTVSLARKEHEADCGGLGFLLNLKEPKTDAERFMTASTYHHTFVTLAPRFKILQPRGGHDLALWPLHQARVPAVYWELQGILPKKDVESHTQTSKMPFRLFYCLE